MEMRRPHAVRQTSRRIKSGSTPLDAGELVTAAQDIALTLPALACRAEAAGLQLVAQHLRKALQLAERVAASDPVQPQAPAIRASLHDVDRSA